MKIEVLPGVIGRSGAHWGTTPSGELVFLVQSSAADVRLVMTPAEARDHGCAAIYLATLATLETQGEAGGARPASLLVGPSGAPL